MYGIPEDLDLSEIVGEFTTQICIGAFDLQVTFGKVSFLVQSEIRLFNNQDEILHWKAGQWPSSELYDLFNLNVISVEFPNNKTISINFEKDLTLKLYDSSDESDSMLIFQNDETIVI